MSTDPTPEQPLNGTPTSGPGPDEGGFAERHLGPDADAVAHMLATLGRTDLDSLIDDAVPASIRQSRPLGLQAIADESEALEQLRRIAGTNTVVTSLIGCGYHDTVTPPVILRNVLENPAWY
ncbi:MAG: glycine dehydrogenase (aminomethyl-transferring), partial [Microthrixaceae bacterium]|nr:glycine dehydrogenase (aminomethyl-transferring) [Microthrixaceae bacterium]